MAQRICGLDATRDTCVRLYKIDHLRYKIDHLRFSVTAVQLL
jgi:hypothetical protein